MRTPDARLALPAPACRPMHQPTRYATLQDRRRRVLLIAIEQGDQALATAALAELGALMGGMVMRYPAFSPLHAAVGRFVTCAPAHFSLPASGRAMALHGAHMVLCGGVLQMAERGVSVDVLAISPAPPSRESRPGAFGGALEARGAHSFSQWGSTGSAKNPWKSPLGGAKSLILEAMPPTSCPHFSTGCHGFSTGRISAARRPPLSFSLSKLLKRKRKKQRDRQAMRAHRHPRVGSVFPRVFTSAYFFIHGFHGSKTANPWKFVESIPFKINYLEMIRRRSTGPQVAMPVLLPHAASYRPWLGNIEHVGGAQ